jgi:hypothetical protein
MDTLTCCGWSLLLCSLFGISNNLYGIKIELQKIQPGIRPMDTNLVNNDINKEPLKND